LILVVPAWARTPEPVEDTRDAVEAARLFEDGQDMLRAGRYGAAGVTFRTLLYVYPESSLAAQARLALRQAEDLEAQAPVVRSVRYHKLPRTLTTEEIRACFAAREIVLAPEQRYDPRDVERARLALQDLLAARGKPAGVRAAVHPNGHPAAPHSVEILFTLARK